MVGVFCWMVWETYHSNQHKNLQEVAYGSARWNRPDALKKLEDKNPEHNWIFTANQKVSIDMGKTGRNRNCFIIGRPGTGKTRYWLMPNLLHANDQSLVITDPKEELVKALGKTLQEKGYEIKVFNLKSKWRSNHYNPFEYIKRIPEEAIEIDIDSPLSAQEQIDKFRENGKDIAQDDVMSLIHAIMMNTQSQTLEASGGDPFWQKAEMVFLQSLFYFTIYKMPKEKQNFQTILRLIRLAKPDEKGRSKLNYLFDQWEMSDPENIGIRQWKHFQIAAGSERMLSTIIMTASARLAPFNIAQIADLVDHDEMELERIGDARKGKVCWFIVNDPNDSSFNFLAALLYTQIFNMIDVNASRNGGVLGLPVNIWMDEFRQIGKIPQFLENLAYVRGLNVGITVILQSLSQFKQMYKDEWETGLDCCDYLLFLGSQSKETLEYLSTILGKQTLSVRNDGVSLSKHKSSSKNWSTYGRELATLDELSKMEKGFGILIVSGMDPFFSKLYQLEKDPDYKKIWNARKSNEARLNPELLDKRETAANEERYYDHMQTLKMIRNGGEAS